MEQVIISYVMDLHFIFKFGIYISYLQVYVPLLMWD